METVEVLKEIYLNPGIHLRELVRRLKLGIPSVKNHLNKLLKDRVIFQIREGRNLKFFLNFKSSKIVSYLYSVESLRLEKLPVARSAVSDLLSALENKPVIALIFGSYAKGDYRESSDLDILLVFNKIKKDIEEKAKIVTARYSIRVQPVYLTWEEFKRKFFDAKDVFIKEIKRSKILVSGIEYWVMLENEKA